MERKLDLTKLLEEKERLSKTIFGAQKLPRNISIG